MSDLLGRLLPSVREIRNPLAVGYLWFVTAWAILTGLDARSSAVGGLVEEMISDTPAVAVVAFTTFLATLVGSGIVRLMDRIMQTPQHRVRLMYNPLDRPDGFSARDADPEFSATLDNFLSPSLRSPDGSNLDGWRRGPENNALESEKVLFRRSLADDPEFGALQSEQLLRFSILPPFAVATLTSIVWWVRSNSGSVGWLSLALVLMCLIAWLDYRRTGTLLRRRWIRLATEYPAWLPEQIRGQRHQHFASRSAHLKLSVNIERIGKVMLRNDGEGSATNVKVDHIEVPDGTAEFDESYFPRLLPDSSEPLEFAVEGTVPGRVRARCRWVDESGSAFDAMLVGDGNPIVPRD